MFVCVEIGGFLVPFQASPVGDVIFVREKFYFGSLHVPLSAFLDWLMNCSSCSPSAAEVCSNRFCFDYQMEFECC